MSQTIFISYSSQNLPWAEALCHLLENNHRTVWMAPRDIHAGATWAEAIIDALNGSKAMLLVFSAQANTSVQVLREVERAVSKQVPIIPLNIDGTKPTASMEYYLSSCHWVMAQPLKNNTVSQGDSTKILQAIGHAFEDKARTPLVPLPAINTQRRKWIMTGMAASGALAAGGYWSYFRENQPKIDGSAMAVMPFANLTKKEELDYLGFAFPCEIESQIGRIADAVIRPFDTVKAFSEKSSSPYELAAALEVGTLITGSFWTIDNQIRLNVKVLDTRVNLQVWAETFEAGSTKLLSLFQTMIPELCKSLRLYLQEGNPASGAGTKNNSAFELYLKGLALTQTHTAENNEQALRMFEQAIELDNQYARSWASLAQAQTTRYYWNFSQDKTWLTRASNSAAKSLSLNSALPEAHLAMAYAQEGLGQRAQAAAAFMRASKEQSNLLPAQVNGARWLFYMGQFDQSLQKLDVISQIDPTHNVCIRQAMNHFFKGNQSRAQELTRLGVQKSNGIDQFTLLAFLSIWLGDQDLADEMQAQVKALQPDAFSLKEIAAWKACLIDKDKNAALLRIEELKVRDSFGIADEIATLYAILNEKQQAIEWLTAAIERGAPNLAWYQSGFFDSVKNEPRYLELIGQLVNEYKGILGHGT